MTGGCDSSIAISIQPSASLALDGIYVGGGVAESTELAVISGSRKIVSWPKMALEELRISPHEEIPKGTQCYFGGVSGDFTLPSSKRPARVVGEKLL